MVIFVCLCEIKKIIGDDYENIAWIKSS